MNPLTLAELKLQHATLAHRAERLRQQWQILPPTAKAAALGKEIKVLQQRADDYAALLDAVATAEGKAT